VHILNADVVIVSFEFILTDEHFLRMPAGQDAASRLYYEARQPGWASSSIIIIISSSSSIIIGHLCTVGS